MLKSVFFQILKLCNPQPPAPTLYKGRGGGGGWVFEIFLKMEGLDFSHKNGVVGKIGRIILERGGGEGWEGYHYFHTK